MVDPANRSNTIIDAKGKGNGIYIDGLDNPGLREVVVTGFTIQNANFEGILVTNASSVSISDNRVVNNDMALNPTAAKCPGQPPFETNEDFDCGEGIHLIRRFDQPPRPPFAFSKKGVSGKSLLILRKASLP